MIGKYFKSRIDTLGGNLIGFLPDHKLLPNIFTITGLFFSLFAGTAFAYHFIRTGGILIFFAGIFDMLDGVYARAFNRTSNFGAFLDSTLDRYADMVILSGLGIHYAVNFRTGYVILTLITIIGFVMVSYTKARAETFIERCDVGYFERPERMIFLIIGALTNKIDIILWILAFLTHITALQRIWFTYKQIEVR